jgi:20S proteasome subunit beta 7
MLPRPLSHSHALGPGVAGPELLIPTPYAIDRPPQHSAQHPLSGAIPFCVDHKAIDAAFADPKHRTQTPYVTGTTVLGIKYKDGVMIACDTLGAYGATKRYKSVQRIHKVNGRCIIAASGELSDFNYILKILEELRIADLQADDGIELSAEEVYSYLSRAMYNRRNKFDPLWNSLVVAGVDEGKAFLGMVGMIGIHYSDSHVTTGFGNQLARPLFREKQHDLMTEQEAAELMHEALRVCYYRDKVSINKFQLAKVTEKGVDISEPFALDMKWDHKLFARPTKWAVGAW